MLSTWLTGFSKQAVWDASGLVSWISVRDINCYELFTSSHRVSHAVNSDDLCPSRRDGTKPRVHGEHAVGETSLQEGQRQSKWQGLSKRQGLSPSTSHEMVSRGTGWRGWEALPTSSLWAPAVLLEAWRVGGGGRQSFRNRLSQHFCLYMFLLNNHG